MDAVAVAVEVDQRGEGDLGGCFLVTVKRGFDVDQVFPFGGKDLSDTLVRNLRVLTTGGKAKALLCEPLVEFFQAGKLAPLIEEALPKKGVRLDLWVFGVNLPSCQENHESISPVPFIM